MNTQEQTQQLSIIDVLGNYIHAIKATFQQLTPMYFSFSRTFGPMIAFSMVPIGLYFYGCTDNKYPADALLPSGLALGLATIASFEHPNKFVIPACAFGLSLLLLQEKKK